MEERTAKELVEEMVMAYAQAKVAYDALYSKAKPLIDNANAIIESVKNMFGLTNSKKEMEAAKASVVTAAKDLPPARTTFERIGWVDVTEQDSVPEVWNLKALLEVPAYHSFIKSVELTDSAKAHLKEGYLIPGVGLVDVLPKVRISVQEYEKNQGDQDEND